MDIQISKDSEVPVHEQIASQIVFLIAAGRWQGGKDLPSVRALAQSLGVHRNTVVQAYQDLILKALVEKTAGRRLTIRRNDPPGSGRGLDGFLNSMLREAKRRGYSLQQVHNWTREKLVAAPPDRIVAISEEHGMRTLFTRELGQRFPCAVEACTPQDLAAGPDRALGAIVLSPPGHMTEIGALALAHPPLAITYAPAAAYIEAIRRMQDPSLVAVVSISEYFLKMARGMLAGAIGRRHSLVTVLMTGSRPAVRATADLVICDSITYPVVKPRYAPDRVMEYRLIARSCLEEVSAMFAGVS